MATRFVDATAESGIQYEHGYLNPPDLEDPEEFGGGVAAGDYDGDGLVDLFIVRGDIGPNLLYRNLGGNTFEDAAMEAGVAHTKSASENYRHSGPAFADMDGDGDLDWFVTSIWSVPDAAGHQNFELGNRLYRNAGGELEDVTEPAGVYDGGWGWGACLADFDNDGDLDIYHTNGWSEPFEPSNFHVDESRFFQADGNGAFVEVSNAVGLADTERGYGIVCADFDNDGDTDIFQAHRNETNAGTLWRNDTGGRYLKLELNGLPPNTEAAGARIRATVGARTQMREIMIGSNFTSQNPTVQMFGLDGAEQLDVLEVEWPDGELTTMRSVAGNQTLRLDHPRR